MIKENKKIIILHVLQILQEKTNKNKKLTQSEIVKELTEREVKCDRKTVGRNINYLIDFGYEIIKLPRVGCYLKHKDKGE